MATLTFPYPGGQQTHSHAGGDVSVAATQRGVVVQRVNGSVTSPLIDQYGRYPLNRGTFPLTACDLLVSVGKHAYGADQADVVVEIN